LACGKEVLEEDVVVVHPLKVQIIVGGRVETAIAAIWVTDGYDCSHVGFLQQHMIPYAAMYDLALAADTDYDTAMKTMMIISCCSIMFWSGRWRWM